MPESLASAARWRKAMTNRKYSKADMETVNLVADAMHDPALGLDRVVSVRAIVKALRKDGFVDAANHLRDAALEAQREAPDA